MVQDGDKYRFEFETKEDVTGLTSALRKERDDASKIKREMETLHKALGDKKPEDIQALLQQVRDAEEAKLKTAGDWDKMKAQMLEEIQTKQIAPLTAERDKLKQAVEKYLVEAQLSQAIAAAGAFPGAEKALLPSVRPFVKVVEENGEFAARVWNPQTDAPMVNEKGENLDFQTLIKTRFRTDEVFGRLFQPEGVGGSGAPNGGTAGNGTSGKTLTRAQFEALSQSERNAKMGDGWRVI